MPTGSSFAYGLRIACRDGFTPTSPHHDDGMRIEPAPSDPGAIGSIPLATADDEPPLEPPL